MRQLSFKGFLYQYVRALSKQDTNNIKVLAEEAPCNYRLVEPLVLYALSVDKRECLQRNAKDSNLINAFQRFNSYSWEDVVSLLKSNDKSVPNEFHKVYRCFLVECDKQKAVDHTKTLLLNRTKDIQKQKGITTYRLYTDLKLNHGNIHAYIKNGDVSKVSLEVAERVFEYIKTV